MKSIAKIIIPCIIMLALMYLLRDGKDILNGLYIAFPILYIIIGIICTDPVRELCACLVLTSLAFLIPVRLFFNMGSCYGLVMIYIGLACISSLISGLIRAKLKKAPHDAE